MKMSLREEVAALKQAFFLNQIKEGNWKEITNGNFNKKGFFYEGVIVEKKDR